MPVFSYTAFGLQFFSQIELPEFLVAKPSNKNDVAIQIGEVPFSLESSSKGILFEANPNQFLLKIEHVAKYYIQNGNSITIQPMSGSISSDIRVFLLGTCMGALLHQRHNLALHASAVATPRGAVLFTGSSGIGKSTLLTALLNRGNKMLTDDISAIFVNQEQVISIMPGFPRTKLWADAAKELQIDTRPLMRTRPQLEKYEYHVPKQFESTAQSVYRIYHLTVNNHDELAIKTISNMRIVQTLVINTYRPQFLDGLAMRATHFQLLSKVAKSIPVFRVSRPRSTYCLNALVDKLEHDIYKNAH